MSLTKEQLVSLGFKPSKRGNGLSDKKYDSLVFKISPTDYLYTGYIPFKNQINFKTIWKSFKDVEGTQVTFQVINLGETGYNELKDYLLRSVSMCQYKTCSEDLVIG
jgi:hypothetical protein